MENTSNLKEPLRINNSGKYELYDYTSHKEIAVSGALLLDPYFETNLNTTIKILHKKDGSEVDRFKLKAFVDPSEPSEDKIFIKGKFFNPSNYYLRVEPANGSDDINFLLYFTASRS